MAEFIQLYQHCKLEKMKRLKDKRLEEFSRNRPEYEIYETKPTNFPLELAPEENIGNIGNKKNAMVFFKREANKCQVLKKCWQHGGTKCAGYVTISLRPLTRLCCIKFVFSSG